MQQPTDSTWQDQVVQICQSLVQLETPSGKEKPVIDRVADWMHTLEFDDIRIDECGNVIGTLHGGEGGPTVMYDSHVDTVPAADAEQWAYPPYSATLTDDRLYGRGTSDMKGALAASMVGLALAKKEGKLAGTALVSASVGEEHIEGLAMGYAVEHYQPDLVIICESTALKLATAQRGRAEINIAVQGKSAHASNPDVGINAFRQMSRLVIELDKLQPPEHELLGRGILEPTTVISSPYPNVSVIPWRCDARYDRRTLVGEDADAVLSPIREVIARLSQEDSKFRAEAEIVAGEFTCYTGLKLEQETFAPAWEMDRNSNWVVQAQSLLGGAELGHYSFCTNGSYSLGRAGIPTLGYGPGYEHSAHTTDEYLELEQLYGAVVGYYNLAGIVG